MLDGAPAHDRQADRPVLAPAKVNLTLHVVGRREDGYHRLDGLVAFADAADELRIADAPEDRLTVSGPMAAALTGGDNILRRALAMARDAGARQGMEIGPLAVHLEKRLPVAAGIGGGSSDAGALLRWIGARHPSLRGPLQERCRDLGADLPMCLAAVPCRVRGIGDIVEPLTQLPALAMVLANPGVPMETPAVFRALAERSNAPPPPLPGAGFRDFGETIDYLAACRNDLEPAAVGLAPEIGEALSALRERGAALARMSGSGATVFALYACEDEAEAAAAALRATRPDWWVTATRCAGTHEEPT